MDTVAPVEKVKEISDPLENEGDVGVKNSEEKELAKLNMQNEATKDVDPKDHRKEDGISDVNQGEGEDVGKEEPESSEEENGSDSDDMFIDDSDSEHFPSFENDDEPNAEVSFLC